MSLHAGPYTRLFTPKQIECLIKTAGEAVHGNAIGDETLSNLQIRLCKRVYDHMQAEAEGEDDLTDISRDALKTDATHLAEEIDDLTRTWNATDEIDTNLGDDVQRAGQRLERLAYLLASALDGSDPPRAVQVHHLSAELGEAVDYYAELEEHETDASIDIFNHLGPGITLVLRILQASKEPAVAERATAGELSERLRRFPADHEVWVASPASSEGYQPLTNQACLGEDPNPLPGEPRQFIVLTPSD